MKISNGVAKNLFDLKNKVIVLAGGLGLLGRDFAAALAGQNARVVILDLADPKKAAAILGTEAGAAAYLRADVTDKKSLEKARRIILRKWKKIDVLINNAGVTHKVEHLGREKPRDWSFENLDLADWNREIAVNLTGAMLCAQVFGAAMNKGGSIINLASVYGVVAPDQGIYQGSYRQPAAYGVTKAGIIYLTKFLASYWGKKGIRVNAIAPGGVENRQTREFTKKYAARTPLGRMAKLQEIGGAVVYLASDASSYVAGAIINVDGGWTAW